MIYVYEFPLPNFYTVPGTGEEGRRELRRIGFGPTGVIESDTGERVQE
jgi:hypothetical protein